MGGQTVMIVPAPVPSAAVQRLLRRELQPPPLLTADPYPVPPARPVRLVPEQLTAEQVTALREENARLQDELQRVRSR